MEKQIALNPTPAVAITVYLTDIEEKNHNLYPRTTWEQI